MEIASLVYLVRSNQVLFGVKKRGFAKGTWNGPGGKIEEEDDSSIENCAVRETFQEFRIMVDKKNLRKKARMMFLRDGKPFFDVHVFVVDEWEGEPQETEEMRNITWFDQDNLPVEGMLESDRDWVPKVLISPQLFKGEVLYDRKMQLIDCQLEEVDFLE